MVTSWSQALGVLDQEAFGRVPRDPLALYTGVIGLDVDYGGAPTRVAALRQRQTDVLHHGFTVRVPEFDDVSYGKP